MDNMETRINIPHEILPQSQDWKNGKIYRVKLVLRQVGSLEDSANFEVLDASPLDSEGKHDRNLLSEEGYLKG